LSWSELRTLLEHLPPTADSAYFRALHPKSWWWTPEIDFLSAILYTVQGANWQRSGGKGADPERITRPSDKPDAVTSSSDVVDRKQVLRDELARLRGGRADG
jgi:hypothetical protein